MALPHDMKQTRVNFKKCIFAYMSQRRNKNQTKKNAQNQLQKLNREKTNCKIKKKKII